VSQRSTAHKRVGQNIAASTMHAAAMSWSAELLVLCSNPAPRYSRCSSQSCASGLAGAARDETHSQSTRVRAASRISTERRHTPGSTIIPASCRNPASRRSPDAAHRLARAGMRERNGPKPLAEHAQHAPQPRSIAWGGGREAAMKGGAARAHLAFSTSLSKKRFSGV
jgi:hypothetical protein